MHNLLHRVETFRWLSVKDIGGHPYLTTFTDFAIVKLLKTDRYNLTNMTQAMVALGQRFGLEVAFSLPESVSPDDLIASHMAYCLGTTENPKYTFAIYPSEPFLSHAAATLLLGTPGSKGPEYMTTALMVLHQKVSEGLLDLRAMGRMWVRIVVSLAKDLLVPPVPEESQLITYCQVVPLVDFLEHLLGCDFWQDVEEAKAEFVKLDAVVNFSHWICRRTANIAPFGGSVT